MPFIKTFHLCLGHQCTLCTITYRRSVVSEGMRNTIVRFWENAGILENVFSVNRIKPPQPGGFVVVLKVKIMMKQLPLVSWMFCFHFKILLLSLELFLFYFGCLFFSPIIIKFLNISYQKKERNTNFQICQSYYCHVRSLWQHEPPWAEVSPAQNGHICKQTNTEAAWKGLIRREREGNFDLARAYVAVKPCEKFKSSSIDL